MSDSAYELFGGDCMKPDFMKLMNRLDFMKLTAQTCEHVKKRSYSPVRLFLGNTLARSGTRPPVDQFAFPEPLDQMMDSWRFSEGRIAMIGRG